MDANRQGLSAAGVAALGVAIVFSAQACGSSKSPSSSPTALGGRVTDSTGAVLAGVTVTAGAASATTGADGTYSLDVSPQANLVVGFSKGGYLPSSKPVDAVAGKSSNVAAALMPVAAPAPLDASAGGTVSGGRGASLTIAPAALVDANGAPVSGMVQVSLTPFDPSKRGELAAYPGSLVGSNGGTPALLHTYGVLDVTVTQNGQPVQVAPGQTATVTIPVAPSANLPPTQDLWSFNMATGIWDHEGTAQLASSGDAYTAQLAHFSYHNIDAQIVTGQATCVTGRVVDATGKPAAGAYVSPSLGASTDGLITTDSDGHYCTWLLTGQSDTITADSTAAPFGEGSITVTGGASVPFPGSYTCDKLNCTLAPDIMLSQPPCTTDADCAGGGSCCTVAGQSHAMCVGDSYVCNEWVSTPIGSGSTGSLTGCKSDSDCTGGNVCCAIAGIASQCVPSQTCSYVNSLPDSGTPNTGCTASQNNGSVSAVINGQTYTFNCFTGFVGGSEGMEILGIQAADANGRSFQISLQSNDNFSGFGNGYQVSLDPGEGGAVLSNTLIVSGTDSSGNAIEMTNAGGTLTFNQWSNASGGTVSFAIGSGSQLSGYLVTMSGSTPATGTIGGTGSVVLYALP